MTQFRDFIFFLIKLLPYNFLKLLAKTVWENTQKPSKITGMLMQLVITLKEN